MGVVHKLRPEVKDFLLAQKNENSSLSCRKLAALVSENFQIELSKSSINIIIKEAGLSAPIGRTPKKRKQRITMPQLPVLLEDKAPKESPQIQAEKEAKRKLQEEEAKKAEEKKWQRLAEEEERIKIARLEEEKRQIEEEARRRKLKEEKLAQEAQEAQKLKQEQAEAEAKKRQLEEEVRLRQLEEERRKEESRRQQEEAVQQAKAAEEEKLKLAQLEEEKRKAEEEAKSRKLQEDKLAQEAQEAEKKRKEEENRKAQETHIAEEEAKRKLQEETAKKAEEEKWQRLAQEEKGAKEPAKPVTAFNIERLEQLENSGVIFLRAVDSMLGTSKLIAASVKNRVTGLEGNFEDIIENLIYLSMIKDKIEPSVLDKLTGLLTEMENTKVLNMDISRIISSSLQEARCVKVILSDNSSLYLDGSMYSVWSSPHIPYDFASPFNHLRKYINKYFNEGSPLVLFNSPGYDMPSQEFFNFLTAFEAKEKSITSIVIYGNKFEELEVMPVATAKKRNFIFASWPWQFNEYRKVKSIGEFRSYRLEEQQKDFYIADIEMELRHPNLVKPLVLSGCAVKLSLNEKTRLLILSNFSPDAGKSEELVATYLNHWPNLEEAFQDYSHKIELFTYTANSQRYFDLANLNLRIDQAASIKDLFRDYLTALDAYLRWHLLPPEYEEKGFTELKERFYDITARLTKQDKNCLAECVLPPDYAFSKDLSYLSRRVNERETVLSGGLKLYIQ